MTDQARKYYSDRLHFIRGEHSEQMKKWSAEWAEEQGQWDLEWQKKYDAENEITAKQENGNIEAWIARQDELAFEAWEERHKYD